jgi:hypothetical protein
VDSGSRTSTRSISTQPSTRVVVSEGMVTTALMLRMYPFRTPITSGGTSSAALVILSSFIKTTVLAATSALGDPQRDQCVENDDQTVLGSGQASAEPLCRGDGGGGGVGKSGSIPLTCTELEVAF